MFLFFSFSFSYLLVAERFLFRPFFSSFPNNSQMKKSTFASISTIYTIIKPRNSRTLACSFLSLLASPCYTPVNSALSCVSARRARWSALSTSIVACARSASAWAAATCCLSRSAYIALLASVSRAMSFSASAAHSTVVCCCCCGAEGGLLAADADTDGEGNGDDGAAFDDIRRPICDAERCGVVGCCCDDDDGRGDCVRITGSFRGMGDTGCMGCGGCVIGICALPPENIC